MNRLAHLLLLPTLLLAGTGTLTQTFRFTPDDFVFDKANGFDVVALPGHYFTSEPGSPYLPLATYNVLIPPDAEVTGVEVVQVTKVTLPGEFDIHPCQRPQVLSQPAGEFVLPDPVVYLQDKPYPSELVRFTRSGLLGGFRIAGLQVAPLQYLPAQKRLVLASSITVVVRYEQNRHDVLALDQSQVSLLGEAARRIVVNPAQAASWAPAVRETDDWLCDMMVVTSSALAASFQPFVEWKTKRGIRTVVVKTESIYSTYPGRDNQERIRNCIIDYWQNHGLKWVLVGGDAEIVPVRLARITCEGTTENIATDFYYADLQYSWDSDHNNYFGEMTDSVDLFHDLFIGRTPADNAADVALFFAKCTTYEKNPDTTYLKKGLMGSTMLFSPFHGRVINRMIAELYPTGWQFSHLEDPPSGQYASQMSAGHGISHVAAHGNQTSFSVMSASEAPGLTNGLRKLCFVNSIACQSGWFDGYECLAEGLTKAPNGGCIAAMLNSRYGFGYPPGFGPSEMLDEQFYLDLLQGRANEFGTLCASSKDFFRSLSLNQEVWRWCVYELNLLGDPTLLVWRDKPRALAVARPSSIPTGVQTCRIQVECLGQPVPRALVSLLKQGETYARGWTNSEGWIDLLVSPASPGNLDLTVTAQDCYVHESVIPVTGTSNAPALVFASYRIDDGNNGRLEPGETADLYVTLTNAGAVAATN
ncbi:MAG: C25 family cysteine peptidase, partial [candidate division WOR-3 bacterium]